jgi:unsaturated rhamnogalacturonyl hydrolase
MNYINEHGDTREVCQGTNKKNDLQYYLDRERNIGDMHGQAPVLWCAAALME